MNPKRDLEMLCEMVKGLTSEQGIDSFTSKEARQVFKIEVGHDDGLG